MTTRRASCSHTFVTNRRHLRSSSSSQLAIPSTWLSTDGNSGFSVSGTVHRATTPQLQCSMSSRNVLKPIFIQFFCLLMLSTCLFIWNHSVKSYGKGGIVSSVGWQVPLCDPIWHVISRSGEVIWITNCYIRVYFTLLYLVV